MGIWDLGGTLIGMGVTIKEKYPIQNRDFFFFLNTKILLIANYERRKYSMNY